MVSSGPYFQTWVERLLRRHNILAGQCQFADLDLERDIHKNGFPCYRAKKGETLSEAEKAALLDMLGGMQELDLGKETRSGLPVSH